MTNDELKIELTKLFPSMQIEEGGEWINSFIEPNELLSVSLELKFNPDLLFDYLFCLTCVDFKTAFKYGVSPHLNKASSQYCYQIKIKLLKTRN